MQGPLGGPGSLRSGVGPDQASFSFEAADRGSLGTHDGAAAPVGDVHLSDKRSEWLQDPFEAEPQGVGGFRRDEEVLCSFFHVTDPHAADVAPRLEVGSSCADDTSSLGPWNVNAGRWTGKQPPKLYSKLLRQAFCGS